MRELKVHKNVAAAVRRVRAQGVPQERQSAELVDILTHVLEENRGPARRTSIAFAVGVANAFERQKSLAGMRSFFQDVYQDLCEDVPSLPRIVEVELLPTLRSLFSAEELAECLPYALRATGSAQ